MTNRQIAALLDFQHQRVIAQIRRGDKLGNMTSETRYWLRAKADGIRSTKRFLLDQTRESRAQRANILDGSWTVDPLNSLIEIRTERGGEVKGTVAA